MTPHPVIPLLTAEELDRLPEDQAKALLLQREALIANEARDPFRYMWLSPVWQIMIAALDIPVPRVPEDRRRRIRARLNLPRPLKFGAFMGGNRSGKSYGSAWLINQVLHLFKHNTACFQYNEQTSIETQHPYCHAMLPAELRTVDGKKIKSSVENISYTVSSGFGPGHYVFPGGGKNVFRYYTQDETAAEGTKYKLIWLDENCPPNVRKNAKVRVGDLEGWLINSFTPINGYTPLVRQLVENVTTLLTVPAFLLPLDGRPPDRTRAFGFNDEEDRLRSESLGIRSRPYHLDRWLDGGDIHTPVPVGRTFAQVPLVQLSTAEPLIILYNHTNNNPYVPPDAVLDTIDIHVDEQVRRRWYGYATSSIRTAFPMFSRKVHVVPASAVPAEGDNLMVCDPGPGTRNYFMIWARSTPYGVFIYREWPGHYPVPGYGIPGAWAIPSEDPNKHDGDRGPAQQSLGFGTLGYKREIARLEGWADYRDDLTVNPAQGEAQLRTVRDTITAWSPARGAREKVPRRIMDSRFGSSVVTRDTGVEDYFSSYAKIGLYFEETAGTRADGRSETETGLGRVTEWLEYDPRQPVDVHNRPRLYISEDCQNCIAALESYTGADGQRGAWKDVVDTIRYLAQAAGVEYLPPERRQPTPGGFL